jgi:hypothetical protein
VAGITLFSNEYSFIEPFAVQGRLTIVPEAHSKENTHVEDTEFTSDRERFVARSTGYEPSKRKCTNQ